MSERRRKVLQASGLAVLGSAFLKRVDAVAATQPSSLRHLLAEQAKAGSSARLLLGPSAGEQGPPEPTRADRLPLESRPSWCAIRSTSST
jgi:hypothetical protein